MAHLESVRPNEQIIYEFSVSLKYTAVQVLAGLLLPFAFYLFYLLLVSAGVVAAESGQVIMLIVIGPGALVGLYLILVALYLRLARHYYLTTQRVIGVDGWLAQQSVSADYSGITDLIVRQDIFERFILGTGSLRVNTAGGPGEEITCEHIDNPKGVRDQIQELTEKAQRLVGVHRPGKPMAPVNVAPADVASPIPTNPEIVDRNTNGVIDREEGQ